MIPENGLKIGSDSQFNYNTGVKVVVMSGCPKCGFDLSVSVRGSTCNTEQDVSACESKNLAP